LQALQRRLAGQLELLDRARLLQLAASRVVALARVGERLPGGRFVAVQVHHLSAESLVPPLGVGPRVLEPGLPTGRAASPQ
jgi:hypothetical protein